MDVACKLYQVLRFEVETFFEKFDTKLDSKHLKMGIFLSFDTLPVQKSDFFQNEEKNRKNRDGETLESIFRLPKKVFMVTERKLRPRPVFYFWFP